VGGGGGGYAFEADPGRGGAAEQPTTEGTAETEQLKAAVETELLKRAKEVVDAELLSRAAEKERLRKVAHAALLERPLPPPQAVVAKPVDLNGGRTEGKTEEHKPAEPHRGAIAALFHRHPAQPEAPAAAAPPPPEHVGASGDSPMARARAHAVSPSAASKATEEEEEKLLEGLPGDSETGDPRSPDTSPSMAPPTAHPQHRGALAELIHRGVELRDSEKGALSSWTAAGGLVNQKVAAHHHPGSAHGSQPPAPAAGGGDARGVELRDSDKGALSSWTAAGGLQPFLGHVDRRLAASGLLAALETTQTAKRSREGTAGEGDGASGADSPVAHATAGPVSEGISVAVDASPYELLDAQLRSQGASEDQVKDVVSKIQSLQETGDKSARVAEVSEILKTMGVPPNNILAAASLVADIASGTTTTLAPEKENKILGAWPLNTEDNAEGKKEREKKEGEKKDGEKKEGEKKDGEKEAEKKEGEKKGGTKEEENGGKEEEKGGKEEEEKKPKAQKRKEAETTPGHCACDIIAGYTKAESPKPGGSLCTRCRACGPGTFLAEPCTATAQPVCRSHLRCPEGTIAPHEEVASLSACEPAVPGCMDRDAPNFSPLVRRPFSFPFIFPFPSRSGPTAALCHRARWHPAILDAEGVLPLRQGPRQANVADGSCEACLEKFDRAPPPPRRDEAATLRGGPSFAAGVLYAQ
jgi:hypothetical protein